MQSKKKVSRIVIFTSLFPPVVSGSSIHSAELSKQLAKAGYEVIVITANIFGSEEYEILDGVKIYRLPSIHLPRSPLALNFPWLNWTYTRKNLKTLEKIFSENPPDIIHLHNHMFDLSFFAVWTKRKYKIPLVITIHTPIKHPIKVYNLLLFPLDRIFIKYTVIRHADILICPDLTIENYVIEAFKAKNKIKIPYGLKQLPKPNPALLGDLIQKFRLSDKKVILSLGHLHEIRNRREIIQALPKIHKSFPKVVLLIIGDIGTKSAEILARSLGVLDSVIFTGPIPHEHLATYLALGDVEAHWFQNSDPDNETLGIAALEAMSAGKVVINTAAENVYGENVLVNGENYINVNNEDPEQVANVIVNLFNNPKKCQSIGVNAALTIQKHFSWESVTRMTLDLYDKLTK